MPVLVIRDHVLLHQKQRDTGVGQKKRNEQVIEVSTLSRFYLFFHMASNR